ncbi:hypothetical protein DYB32_007716 [Aphanomyces invadans]|uniref:Protein kinase domain-containing protein n=1 Tax=Aphanomyces invadans TaxID=157072 RepID=A0A418AN65_9STRA|nr:hypothetical protein DYB32_007716 [Aphanomyces invadans]
MDLSPSQLPGPTTVEASSPSTLLVVAAAAILLLAVTAVVFCRRRMLLRHEQHHQQLAFHRHLPLSTAGGSDSPLFTLTRAPALSPCGSDGSFALLGTIRPDIVLHDHMVTPTAQAPNDATNGVLASSRRLSHALSRSFVRREGELNRPQPIRPLPATQPVVHVASSLAILPSSDVIMVSPVAHGSSIWNVMMLHRPYIGKRVRYIAMDNVARNEFFRDLNAAATHLVHPNIVVLYGIVHLPDNDLCVVAEWMARGSLGLLLRHQTPTPPRPYVMPLTWSHKVQLAWDIASALACVHSQPNFKRSAPWTTRDILVNAHGRAKLNVFDFMASKSVESTYGHQVLAYEAPEVVAHQCMRSSTSDIYTLGVVLGEIATRSAPYQHWIDAHGHVGSDVCIVAIMHGAASENILPHEEVIKAMRPAVPVSYQALMSACLQRDVLKRPLAVHVADELARCLCVDRKTTS